MKDLIEALTIFMKYQGENVRCPTHCEHDVMYIMKVTREEVSEADKQRLKDLGFIHSVTEGWLSYRFGSA